MAFQIIRHAFGMIFGNLGQAMRVSIGPYVLLIVGVVFGFMLIGFPDSMAAVPQSFNPIAILVVPLMVALAFFVFGWVAVSWHRFILLEEYVGVLPVVSDRPIWPYVWRSFLYGLLLVAVAIPILFIFSIAASPFLSASPSLIVSGILSVGGAIIAFVWFRIAIALPAIAVGRPITLGQAWSASSGIVGTIFGVALILMLINGAAELVIGLITLTVPIIGFVVNLAVQWLLLMLGISILTTFYGHVIEKRPLVD